MFDFVQKNKRILQLFLGLIALTFATWGIESYTRFAGGLKVSNEVLAETLTRLWINALRLTTPRS